MASCRTKVVPGTWYKILRSNKIVCSFPPVGRSYSPTNYGGSLGPGQATVAGALDIQSQRRASRLVFEGATFCFLGPRRTMENPRIRSFALPAVCRHQILIRGNYHQRPSGSEALDFVAASVKQQSHIKLVPLSRQRAVLRHVCVCVCVRACMPCFLAIPILYGKQE